MITPSFEIDQEAQKVFRSQIPNSWIIREQRPDFYVDYVIEVTKNNESLGIKYGVQLKGRGKVNLNKVCIKLQFEVKHLIYFLDKASEPIYIILVDIKSKNCYWLFIQEYLKTLPSNKWRKQKTLTIKIPVENKLSNINNFINKIKASDKFMRNLRPSSIPVAISAQKDHWKILDPRLDFNVHYVGNNLSFDVIAKEKITLSLVPKNKNKWNEINNKLLIDEEVIKISMEDAEIKGSRVFEEIISNAQGGELVLKKNKLKLDSKLVFKIFDIQTQSIEVLVIPGQSILSKEKTIFTGELERAPFQTELTIQHWMDKNLEADINFNFPFEKWCDIDLKVLPYRDRLEKFFLVSQSMHKFIVELEINGNTVFKSDALALNYNAGSILSFLASLKKAIHISNLTNTHLKFPAKENFSKEDIQTIDVLYDILTKGESIREGKDYQFVTKLKPFENAVIKAKKGQNQALRIASNVTFRIFNQQIFLNLICEHSHVKLVTDLTKLDINSIRKNNKVIELKWIGQKDSKLVMKKVD